MCFISENAASCHGKWSRRRYEREIKSHKTIKKVPHYARLADLCNCSCRDLYAVNKKTRGICNELHSCARERVLSQPPRPPPPPSPTRTHIYSRGTRTHRNRMWPEPLPVWEHWSRLRHPITPPLPPKHLRCKGRDLTLRIRTRTNRTIDTGKITRTGFCFKEKSQKKKQVQNQNQI